METTTTHQINEAFVAAIQAITPTFAPLRTSRWSYTPVGRKGGKALLAGEATRCFDLIWGAGVPSYLWFGGGEAYQCKLCVATSYASVEPALLEHMITADGVDLRRALSMLRDPTLPGLADVVAGGTQDESVDSEANATLSFVFTVHWHQHTETY